jgi:hypothetical protein
MASFDPTKMSRDKDRNQCIAADKYREEALKSIGTAHVKIWKFKVFKKHS